MTVNNLDMKAMMIWIFVLLKTVWAYCERCGSDIQQRAFAATPERGYLCALQAYKCCSGEGTMCIMR